MFVINVDCFIVEHLLLHSCVWFCACVYFLYLCMRERLCECKKKERERLRKVRVRSFERQGERRKHEENVTRKKT